MSVNPLDISAPLLLLAPPHWPAAIRGDYSGVSPIFDLHPHGGPEAATEAPKALSKLLRQRDAAKGDPLLVRIGGFRDGLAEKDLEFLDNALPDGIVLSGCRNAADIQKLDVSLSVIEAGRNLPIGTTAILAECGAEPEFFLSPHSLSGKSARLRGLVFNRVAFGGLTSTDINGPLASGALSFSRAVCILKAAETRIPCYEILPPGIGLVDLLKARAESKANGFTDIVVPEPAHLAALMAATIRV